MVDRQRSTRRNVANFIQGAPTLKSLDSAFFHRFLSEAPIALGAIARSKFWKAPNESVAVAKSEPYRSKSDRRWISNAAQSVFIRLSQGARCKPRRTRAASTS